MTVLFVYVVSFPIGIYSATRQYSWGDYGFTLLGYLGLATPNFLLGLIMLYLANSWFGLSIGGLMDPQYIDKPWSVAKVGSVLAHLIVPTVVIGTSGTAAMIRRLRANLLDELHKQYVTTARAKGLKESRLLVKYPLRVALNPFIADIGNLIPSLVSGSVIVSVVLNLPTVGPVLLGALQSQDQFLAGFILLFVAVADRWSACLCPIFFSRCSIRAFVWAGGSRREHGRGGSAALRQSGSVRSGRGGAPDAGTGTLLPGLAMADHVVEIPPPTRSRCGRASS